MQNCRTEYHRLIKLLKDKASTAVYPKRKYSMKWVELAVETRSVKPHPLWLQLLINRSFQCTQRSVVGVVL